MMEYKIYGEAAYLDLARRILKDGKYRQEGDEFGRYELFAQPLKFDLLGNKLPLLTTKRVFFRGLAHEMLWFISGKTKIDYLKENDVKIWDIWADENNDVGPLYGYQWRHWRVDPKMRPYVGSDEIDQVAKVMKSLRDRPEARSHVISAWRPDHGPAMSIKPCHILLQFYRIPLSWDERVRYYADVIAGAANGSVVSQLYECSGDDQDHEYLDRNGVPKDGLSLSLTQRSQERLH